MFSMKEEHINKEIKSVINRNIYINCSSGNKQKTYNLCIVNNNVDYKMPQ